MDLIGQMKCEDIAGNQVGSIQFSYPRSDKNTEISNLQQSLSKLLTRYSSQDVKKITISLVGRG